MTQAIEQVQTGVMSLTEQVHSIQVIDQQTFDYASDLLNAVVKRLRRQIAEHHDPLIKSAHTNWKMNIEAKQRLDAPLDGAERMLKDKIGAWLRVQEQIRQAIQRTLEADAQKKAEEEQLARAASLITQGAEQEVVEAELEKPVVVEQVARAEPTFFKRPDVGTVTTYSAEVFDFAALVKAAAQNPMLMGYLEPNMVALNAAARSQKDLMSVPGVKLLSRTDVRGRAR